MIKTYKDLKFYIAQDRVANGLYPKKDGVVNNLRYYFKINFDKRIKFHTLLRKHEYCSNSDNLFLSIVGIVYYYKFKSLSYKLGLTIHKNCFGPGLCIKHFGSIVVNPKARIGSNCTIHTCVNIGETDGKAPTIGNNAYIGPGAKVFGDIVIGDNVKIGANAVVFKSYPNGHCTLVGVPSREIR